ncbi:MAG: hypothetical protein R8M45_05710 [Ghiorsea sp.]
MTDRTDDIATILEKATGESRMFSTKEIIIVGMIIFMGAGQWYATQARIDRLEAWVKTTTSATTQNFKQLHAENTTNARSMLDHVQWEMEVKLKEKEDLIKELMRKTK